MKTSQLVKDEDWVSSDILLMDITCYLLFFFCVLEVEDDVPCDAAIYTDFLRRLCLFNLLPELLEKSKHFSRFNILQILLQISNNYT